MAIVPQIEKRPCILQGESDSIKKKTFGKASVKKGKPAP